MLGKNTILLLSVGAMLPPLFLLEAGTIRFEEGYSEKGRKGNHLYFSRNAQITAKTA